VSNNAAFSTLELAQMQADNLSYMMDTAIIYTRSDTLDAYGQPIPAWTEGATIPCGFGFSPFKFRSRELGTYGAEETSEILVRARVPLDYIDTLTTNDRLYLTHLKGVALSTPDVYDIQGFEEPGPSAMVVNLKRVEL
jgi:hypothetical protein